MGLMASIRQFFGIGGIKVAVECPEKSIAKDARQVTGKVKLISKSDQHVLTLDVKMVEKYKTGANASEGVSTEKIELGTINLGKAFDMKAGEEKVIDFTLPFELDKSCAGADPFSFSLSHFVVAECDVKGTALDPSGKFQLQLT